MDINDKSTALVSVSDLSAVLQGVKRYIDSSKPNVSWDELANGETIHCDDWHHTMLLGSAYYSGVKIPTKAIVGNVVSLKNLKAESDLVSNGEVLMSKEDLQQMLPNTADITLSDNNIGVYDGCVVGIIEAQDYPFLFLFGEEGGDCVYLSINPVIKSNIETPLLSCDLVQDASLCPPSYVASSIGNESLEEDIKFLKENSGKVTIDGLVKQEFGTLVSGEVDGILFQGILTNIPAQEGVSFKLSNIHYAGDIRYYNASLTEEPEVSRTKEEANQLLHYPRELSGTIQYLEGQFVYMEYSGNLFYALLDLGFDYMVYVDNLGVELTRKPFISYPLKLEVSSLISPDYIDSSLGKANLREDLESLHLGKTTKWVDTKIAKVGSDAYAGIPWKDEYQYPKAIRYILDGVEIDSENLPEGNTLTIEPSDSFGINWMQIEVNGEPQFLYGDGSLAGVAGLLVLCASDDFVLEKLELKVESVNTISSEFVANMPYIGYNTISSGITEVEPNVTGLPYEKGLKLDATTFSGAISVNGEVFDITMTSGDGTLFGNIEILSGSYKEGDVPYVGMIGLDDDGKVLVIVGSMKPISSVELLQKEWRRKLPKEAIEGDDNESTDTFVAYNYLYLGKAHVEGNKLYLDNAEVEDNKLIIK